MAHDTTHLLLLSLGSAFNRDTAGRLNDALEAWLDGTGHLLGEIDDLVRGEDGWVQVLDPARAPVDWLGWLGQFAGVHLLPELSEAAQRARIVETSGQQRGSVGALRGAARQLLDDTRLVRIDERRLPDHTTDPYHVVVTTYTSETTDPDAVLRLLEAEKPAGLVLHYQVRDMATLGEINMTFDSLAAVDNYFDTIGLVRTYSIGERAYA